MSIPSTQTVAIQGAYIELQQLIKRLDLVQSGGEVKQFLAEVEIIVNGDYESRRGRKLYPGDLVMLENIGTIEIIEIIESLESS